jgi:hypothetical protein
VNFKEPTLIINGHHLNDVQASVVRCAIAALLTGLAEDDFCKEIGSELTQNYRKHLVEIEKMMGVRPQ